MACGILCDNCVHDILDSIPDPPGLICVQELSKDKTCEIINETPYFLKEIPEAMLFFKALFPNSADITDWISIRLHREGYKEEAYKTLEEGIDKCDESERLYLELAAFCDLDGDVNKGFEYLERVSPSVKRYHVIKGNLLKQIGKWDVAAECWVISIEDDPEDVISWFNLGYYLLHVKKYFEIAEDHYRNASTSFPEIRRFRAYLGDSLFNQNKLKEALIEYIWASDIPDGDENLDQNLRKMIRLCEERIN